MKVPGQIKQIKKKSDDFLSAEQQLSGSELNSYLLGLYRRRVAKITPADLLHHYQDNRFVQPSDIHPVAYKKLEIEWLTYAEEEGFSLLSLSPLSPLGSCSVVAEVSQNNVVSASRASEVIADVTNVMALQVAQDQKNITSKDQIFKYACTHRQVRAQAYNNPAFSPHFGIFGMVSGGYDAGNFTFELEQLLQHVRFYYTHLSAKFGEENLLIKLFLKDESHPFHDFLNKRLEEFPAEVEMVQERNSGDYYQLFQFKIYLKKQKMEIDLADGGMVNWTQKLSSNKKHRLFISGCGLESVYRFLHHEIH